MTWQISSGLYFLAVYTGLIVVSIAFAHFILRLQRKSEDQSNSTETIDELSSLQAAFLIGGAARVRDLAFFQLVRDSWLVSEGGGRFRSRFQTGGDSLSESEGELLAIIVERGGVETQDLRQIELKSAVQIERALIKGGLLIKRRESVRQMALSLLPMGFTLLFGFREIALQLARGGVNPGLLLAHLFALSVLFRFRRLAGQLTATGESSLVRLRADRDRRARASGEEYDRLWVMKDQVLFAGLDALRSTVFSASSLPDHRAGKTGSAPSEQKPMAAHTDSDLRGAKSGD